MVNSDSLIEALKKEFNMELSMTEVLICLSGWYPIIEKKSQVLKGSLQCWLCHRKLGLWNFDQKKVYRSKSFNFSFIL
ncbi:hypothetical protein K502DRAFT_325957 [Neoconidiobolus thromboides FSU 785]|nr:hypothetical protein K502DRAFT_325957 [Neoconidiobolus thromboides FSU 785]